MTQMMSAIAPLGPQFISQLGISHWAPWLFATASAVAAYTDYRSGKIYNWLTLPLLALAFAIAVTAAIVSGPDAFLLGLAGFGVTAAIFIPLFCFGVIGGGDVKLLLALALALGWRASLELIYGTFCIAGIGAFVILARRRRIMVFMRECALFLRSIAVKQLEVHWPRLSRDYRAPFGIAIFIGYVLAVLRFGAISI